MTGDKWKSWRVCCDDRASVLTNDTTWLSLSHWGMFVLNFYIPHKLDPRAVYQCNNFGDLD